MKKISILIMLVIISGTLSFGQKNEKAVLSKQDSVELYNRIEKTEKFQELVKEDVDIKVRQIEQKLDSDYEYMKWIGIIGGSFTVIGLGWAIISIIIKLKKIGIAKSEEIIEKKFHEEKDKILKLVENQTEENQFKQNKRILILSHSETEDIFLKKFFKELGFLKANFKKIDGFVELENHDVLFFNNENGKFEQGLIEQLIENSDKNTVFFYFGSIRIKDFGTESRVVATNYKTQIYGNLINALKYQKILQS